MQARISHGAHTPRNNSAWRSRDWTWTLVIAAGLAGGVLSVIIGELVTSGAFYELVRGYQTLGSELGGALNNVSHGEWDVMRRTAIATVWSQLS